MGIFDAQAYPPVAFYFRVSLGLGLGGLDTSFSEVSGIENEMATEEVVEGGENRYMLQLPKGAKHPNLELKRGIATLTSPLMIWCKAVLEGDLSSAIITSPLLVSLMDGDQLPIRSWSFFNAWPVKWSVEGFNSTKNEVAIEKIVLSYSYATRLT
jgi:phage tail-like protein